MSSCDGRKNKDGAHFDNVQYILLGEKIPSYANTEGVLVGVLVPVTFDNRPTLTLSNLLKSGFDETLSGLVKGVFDNV